MLWYKQTRRFTLEWLGSQLLVRYFWQKDLQSSKISTGPLFILRLQANTQLKMQCIPLCPEFSELQMDPVFYAHMETASLPQQLLHNDW